MDVKEDKFYTVVIGKYNNLSKFLVAPTGPFFENGDIVTGEDGIDYEVVFSTSYVDPEDRLFVALHAAFADPVKIEWHMSREEVKWNENAANTSCDDDSRSGSGDGDGTEVHG